MNERIEKLAIEAALTINTGKGNTYVSNTEFNKRFAELIVRECGGIYSKIDNGNQHLGTDDYLEALHKTFFGVEE